MWPPIRKERGQVVLFAEAARPAGRNQLDFLLPPVCVGSAVQPTVQSLLFPLGLSTAVSSLWGSGRPEKCTVQVLRC